MKNINPHSLNLAPLLTWYQIHQRALPFRQAPSAYGIWVSEVMLQQTQMETVLKYYSSFLDRFPTIEALAKTPLETVLTEVQGLGYYRRFRLLHQGAQYLVNHHHGHFPKTYKEVLAIPGVGAYTAGAIMAIAFNQPYPATDGNVIRVLSRVFGVKQDMRLPRSRKIIDDLHGTLVRQSNQPAIYIQAVMELGALVCRPVKPICHQCPLQANCLAYQQGITHQLPVISKNNKTKTKEWHTILLIKNQKLLLRKNQSELLKDFYLLPQWDGSLDMVDSWLKTQGFSPHSLSEPIRYKHVFTHQTWFMDVYVIKTKSGNDPLGTWVPFQELANIPIPEAHQKIIRQYIPQYQKAKAL